MNSTDTRIAKVEQRLEDFEIYVRERFADGDKRMDKLATREDLAVIHSALIDDSGQPKFIDREAMARLNNIVYNFTLAAEVLAKGGKWAYRFVIGLAALIGAFSVISSHFRLFVMNIIHSLISGN